MTDITDLLEKLKNSRRGLCTENPEDYMATGLTVADALQAAEEIERLRKALKPFANLHLYPYDIEGQLEFEKENNDWSEQENDDVIDDFFIRRGDIRNARKILEE